MSTRKLAACILVVLVVSATPAFAGDILEAAKKGDFKTVKNILVGDPTQVGTVDEKGYTPLHWASIRAHWDVVGLLMMFRPDVNAKGADGGTPLHCACHHDRPDVVEQMLDMGASLNAQNKWGRTPLHTAVRRGCSAVVKLLLIRGANLNATTVEGWTPLHVAYRSGHKDVIEILQAGGSLPGVRDNLGKTPPDRAIDRPPAGPLGPGRLDEYVGVYAVGRRNSVEVWKENDSLWLVAFAPDELYPIGPDSFYCRREPWTITFRRNEDGEVDTIELELIRSKVSGKKLPKSRRKRRPHPS